MKQSLFIFLFCLAIGFTSSHVIGQPTIGNPTIIPTSPTSNDVIKLATFVSTPNQGIVVDVLTHTVMQNPQEINIRGCYWQGLATAIQEYRDTLTIGQLPSGNYTIKFKTFLSSTQQHCSATDSTIAQFTFTVTGITTGLSQLEKSKALFCYPNPAKETLYLKNNSNYSKGVIYSVSGSLVKETKIDSENRININELSAGLYYIRLTNNDRSEIMKFIKED